MKYRERKNERESKSKGKKEKRRINVVKSDIWREKEKRI